MKRENIYLLLAVLAFLGAGALFFKGGGDTITDVIAAEGDRQAFELKGLDGNDVRLDDLKGNVVLVNFWATWCPPCRAEMPHFSELQNELGKKGLVILGLSVDQKGEEFVREWLAERPVGYRVAMSNDEVTAAYQLLIPAAERGGIPFTVIFDREGKIVHRLVGYRDKTQWKAMIDPLL